ncbi:Efflux pump periplasmic linker BepF [Posidoniimonas polymericola]|uniref:Efflux pump periplasmic linker BepF n=1 Tax=Posidoniimonas polymericola TaxID=2528002 RepID=A0A5C5YUB3_9BACT|nr:efflux RND transporter periplasmic adaptor subunit [Posidoniimonas polymericola]TWT78421.1 Efflux pump periplasmic linker BepF [Posidoniimonas polymericola]
MKPTQLLPLALACLIGCGAPKQSGPAGAPPPPQVKVARPVVMELVDWDPYIGRLEAVESVDVRANVSGYLMEHYFEEGQIVRKGEPLFLIDPRPFEAQLAEAEAGLNQAQADHAEAQAFVLQSEAERGQVQARLDLANSRLKRAKPLAPTGAITGDELDIMESERQQAEADLNAADAIIESSKARVVAAKAAVTSAEAAVRTAWLNVSYTQIDAPIGGRISRRYATTGNLITGGIPGSTLLTTIVSLDPIHCYFDANERALLKYTRLAKSGQRGSSRDVKNPVFLSLVDESGFPHKGHMDFVDNRVDESTGTMRGRAIFPNPDQLLSPGMFAKIRIPGSGQYEALLIPDSAVGFDQSEQFVYVVGEGSKAERRLVELGPMSHGLRVVRQGIEHGDEVVVGGLQMVRAGAPLSPDITEVTASSGDGLPTTYQPVPKQEWLTAQPASLPTARTASTEGTAG